MRVCNWIQTILFSLPLLSAGCNYLDPLDPEKVDEVEYHILGPYSSSKKEIRYRLTEPIHIHGLIVSLNQDLIEPMEYQTKTETGSYLTLYQEGRVVIKLAILGNRDSIRYKGYQYEIPETTKTLDRLIKSEKFKIIDPEVSDAR
ncbi:MAG: hypothetical protein MPJ24_09550 [Pirellulaceae bacterium]|nr:hypothetical protein [Pirellulaceae bacterium]